jgi:hypothetical protein
MRYGNLLGFQRKEPPVQSVKWLLFRSILGRPRKGTDRAGPDRISRCTRRLRARSRTPSGRSPPKLIAVKPPFEQARGLAGRTSGSPQYLFGSVIQRGDAGAASGVLRSSGNCVCRSLGRVRRCPDYWISSARSCVAVRVSPRRSAAVIAPASASRRPGANVRAVWNSCSA